jgi:hypothetical protein
MSLGASSYGRRFSDVRPLPWQMMSAAAATPCGGNSSTSAMSGRRKAEITLHGIRTTPTGR